jgi:hypothetical protein
MVDTPTAFNGSYTLERYERLMDLQGLLATMSIKYQTSLDYRIFKFLGQVTYEICDGKFLQDLITFPLTRFEDILNFPLHRKPESYLPAFLFEKGFLQ